MVATWNPAAASSYYTRGRETEYYAGSSEPAGVWFAPAGDFNLTDGSVVKRETFERLYNAVGEDGHSLLEKTRRHKERTPAFDVTLSAPRSVSLAWAFAPPDARQQIEVAQLKAARATLTMLEREATWARRGRDGIFIERVPLSGSLFQHGESRSTEHADGRVFGDPNLHTHAVILNMATRADGTVGALHSKIIRDYKMTAGAIYHAALANELEAIGFEIDRVGKNGIFELAGIDDPTIRYFSARRHEIEAELSDYGVVSSEAVALAAAITKATRQAKRENEPTLREETWHEAARSIGLDTDTFTEQLRNPAKVFDRDAAEQLLAARMAALPAILTEHESVIERRELLRSVAAALVGTGLPAERADIETDRLLHQGAVLEIGKDAFGLPCYSTPEMLAIEREVVEQAQQLAAQPWHVVDQKQLTQRCGALGLTSEQTEAAFAAASASAISMIEGAPGVGKTTLLSSVVEAYSWAGYRIVGTATAWRIANMLREELGIESRATASWIERLKSGEKVLDHRTVLIADEAGLLSSREMHVLLKAVAESGAKIILVGDRQQLQAVNAGPGLDLVTRAVEAAKVNKIVRQKEPWLREAITAFGQGQAVSALEVFADRGLLIEAQGGKASIDAVLDAAEQAQQHDPASSVLLLAKSNAAVAAISRVARERARAKGLIKGAEVSFTAATPSGHATQISLAAGDKIRLLVRDDALGVVNGTTATVVRVSETPETANETRRILIEADVGNRQIVFDPMQLADVHGRPRIGWGYASSIFAAQGQTVDHAVVYIDQNFNRHDIYVAASRARAQTTLVVDAKSIDRRLTADLPFDRQRGGLVFEEKQRSTWLAERLSRASPKISTLDIIESRGAPAPQVEQVKPRRQEFSHEL